jgi:hypothetical protein
MEYWSTGIGDFGLIRSRIQESGVRRRRQVLSAE